MTKHSPLSNTWQELCLWQDQFTERLLSRFLDKNKNVNIALCCFRTIVTDANVVFFSEESLGDDITYIVELEKYYSLGKKEADDPEYTKQLSMVQVIYPHWTEEAIKELEVSPQDAFFYILYKENKELHEFIQDTLRWYATAIQAYAVLTFLTVEEDVQKDAGMTLPYHLYSCLETKYGNRLLIDAGEEEEDVPEEDLPLSCLFYAR